MIRRYTRQEMGSLWTDQNRYLVWLQIETSVCAELAKEGSIPPSVWKKLSKKLQQLIASGGVDPARVEYHEQITRHDVIAFTTAVAEQIGSESRYVHFGLTSSDVVDTAQALLLQQAGRLLLLEIESLLKTLKALAKRYQNLPTIGRSHGIFAEPTSFGLKFLSSYCEWRRLYKRLSAAVDQIGYGKLSGAVGVNAHFSPLFETRVLKRLGLKREPVSTQVIPRDRHAEFFSVIALGGASMERMCIELRHLQRSEVGEVTEGFRKGQKGSSAMPHKRNPISSENLTGCARLLRSYAQAAFENVALWHERDISHSSVERLIAPDATILFHYSIGRFHTLLKELEVNEKKVRSHLESAGPVVFSGHYLLALVEKGVSREDAYRWIQDCALRSFASASEGEGGKNNMKSNPFIENLLNHEGLNQHLSAHEIKRLGSLKYQLRHVAAIYREALSLLS